MTDFSIKFLCTFLITWYLVTVANAITYSWDWVIDKQAFEGITTDWADTKVDAKAIT